MSLFPAYSDENVKNENETITDNDNSNWLDNSSFPVPLAKNEPNADHSSSSTGSEEESGKRGSTSKRKPKKKHKREKKKKKKSPKDERTLISESGIETESAHEVLYDRPCKSLPGVATVKYVQRNKKKKVLRYFSRKSIVSGQNDEIVGEELSKNVEELNRAVHENDADTETWLRLVSFQDEYFKFQPIRYKTCEERVRAASMKKLAIIERAMECLPYDEKLQRTWMSIALDHCSFSEVDSKLSNMLDKQDSFVLWMGHILILQQSMPRSTVPSTIDRYKKALAKIQKVRHWTDSVQDSYTLELLFHVCTYLQQAGLLETMWKVLKLNLNLNLSMEIPSISIDNQVVLEQENKILEGSSNVPIWNLWLRIESLRKGYHFLPVSQSTDFPQRVVSSDEVFDLIFHVKQSSQFTLVVMVPLLANVPLMPRSHSAWTSLCSQQTPWLLDTVEQQLAVIFSASPLLNVDFKFLTSKLPLSHPPQYLMRIPGQEQFMKFVSELFDNILSKLEGRQYIALGVWYLRFLRWLDKLEKLERFDRCAGSPKTKTLFKDFLKLEKNRDIILFYVEYALWQFECGDSSSSIKTLETLASSHMPVLDQADENKKSDLCRLYRSLCEVLIATKNKAAAMNVFTRLCKSSSDEIVQFKLKQIAIHALATEVTKQLEDLMLPCFSVDWTACYVWYLALAERGDEGESFLNVAINDASPAVRELLFELLALVTKIFPGQRINPEIHVVKRALNEFPVNTTFTALMADALLKGGGLWWKDSNYLLKPPVTAGAILLVCSTLQRLKNQDGQDERYRGLLKRLTSEDAKTSSVLQRMYIKYLLNVQDLSALDSARILALEACPWNKALYMDIISALPAQLMALTDLLVEKELRVHITPDEVDAMRD